MPLGCCDHVGPTQSIQSKRGDEYQVANGETIPNVGEIRLEVKTRGSETSKLVTSQVADVHKPLLSTARMADMGFDAEFTSRGGWIRHRDGKEISNVQTGQPLLRDGVGPERR